MIKARFSVSDDKKTLILTVKGHANAGEAGHDIVCASASILYYTMAQIVKSYSEGGMLKKQPTINIAEGDAVITAKPNRAYFEEMLYSFLCIQTGFILLAKNYPDFVEVTPFDKGKFPFNK